MRWAPTVTLLFTTNDYTTGESIPAVNGSGGTTLGFFFDDLETSDEATPTGKVYDVRMWANQALTQGDLQDALLPPARAGRRSVEPGRVDRTLHRVNGAARPDTLRRRVIDLGTQMFNNARACVDRAVAPAAEAPLPFKTGDLETASGSVSPALSDGIIERIRTA